MSNLHVTKSCMGKSSIQNVRCTNGFLCNRVQKVQSMQFQILHFSYSLRYYGTSFGAVSKESIHSYLKWLLKYSSLSQPYIFIKPDYFHIFNHKRLNIVAELEILLSSFKPDNKEIWGKM